MDQPSNIIEAQICTSGPNPCIAAKLDLGHQNVAQTRPYPPREATCLADQLGIGGCPTSHHAWPIDKKKFKDDFHSLQRISKQTNFFFFFPFFFFFFLFESLWNLSSKLRTYIRSVFYLWIRSLVMFKSRFLRCFVICMCCKRDDVLVLNIFTYFS